MSTKKCVTGENGTVMGCRTDNWTICGVGVSHWTTGQKDNRWHCCGPVDNWIIFADTLE